MNQLAGLQNIGNTCFMNSSLQLILRSDDLINFFTSNNFKSDVLNTFKKFIEEYKSSKLLKGNSIHPIKKLIEKKSKEFCGYNQEDSHEFYIHFLDLLDEEIKKEFATKNKDSDNENLIEKIYDTKLKTTFLSEETKDKSEIISNNRLININFKPSEAYIELSECLRRVVLIEKLDGDCKWKPEGKKKGQKANKITHPINFPKYLTVLLIRYQHVNGYAKKLNININTKQYWKSNVFPANKYYKFCGFVLQSGSMRGGHYVSYIEKNGKWWLCDDGRISVVSYGTAINRSRQAYMLLFEQKDEREEPCPEEPEVPDIKEEFSGFMQRNQLSKKAKRKIKRQEQKQIRQELNDNNIKLESLIEIKEKEDKDNKKFMFSNLTKKFQKEKEELKKERAVFNFSKSDKEISENKFKFKLNDSQNQVPILKNNVEINTPKKPKFQFSFTKN